MLSFKFGVLDRFHFVVYSDFQDYYMSCLKKTPHFKSRYRRYSLIELKLLKTVQW